MLRYSEAGPENKRPTRQELAEAFSWYLLGLLEDGVVEDQAERAQAGLQEAQALEWTDHA